MHPMLKLLVNNRHKGFFKTVNRGDGDKQDAPADTIYLYDVIVDSDAEADYWGGVSAQQFVKTLAAMTAPVIHLRVNSPGGSVFAARAMEQAIREHPSQIVVHIDGLAASAASFLVQAAGRIEMARGAFIMIHKAWTVAWGNADELVATAALLERLDASLVQTYATRTGQPEKQIEGWLRDETWFDADEAVALKFADAIAADNSKGESANACQEAPAALAHAWDLSAYQHVPDGMAVAVPAEPALSTDPALPSEPALPVDRGALHRAVLARLIPA